MTHDPESTSMMHHVSSYLILGFVGLLLAGCDTNNFETHTPEVVVESYLIAGEPIGIVRLSRSSTVSRVYEFAENAVTEADVRILLLAADGSVEQTYTFTSQFVEPGIYRPAPVPSQEVLPGRTYRLEVEVNDSREVISATTIVPGTFDVVRASADTIQYQGTGQLELDVTRSFYPGRQSIFIFSTESLDPRAELLTPFYKRVVGDNENDIADLRITESPIINEANYDVNEDGTLTIKLPWIAVAFYGPNVLTANALDTNMYDFIRTYTVQQGGSTLAPGEIPNVIDHIEGGNGIFGSLARSSFSVYIRQ